MKTVSIFEAYNKIEVWHYNFKIDNMFNTGLVLRFTLIYIWYHKYVLMGKMHIESKKVLIMYIMMALNANLKALLNNSSLYDKLCLYEDEGRAHQ